jgi:signal transduction histidine kinase
VFEGDFVPKSFARTRGKLVLGHHLVLLVAIAIVPLLAFAGWIIHDIGREHRSRVEYGLRTTARALAIAVEREILATQRTLEVLATSELLRHDDLPAFHAEALRMIRVNDMWYVVGLTDPRGQILLSTLRPFGTTLPDIGDRDYFRKVASGRPSVSDLISGRTTGTKNITVTVPVTHDGVLRYVLFAGLNLEAIGRILNAGNIPADWISDVADTHQILIARNRDPERFIGRELISPLAQAVRAAPEGVGRFPVYDSPDVYSAWYRLPSLGWTVTLGAPMTFVEAPLQRSLWRITMVGIVLAVGGGGIALVWGRRISASMGALVSTAGSLGRGEPVTCPSSPVAEVEAVGHAIRVAGATIAERTEELIASQHRLKRLVDSSLIGILVGEGDRIVDVNDALLRTIGVSRADLRDGRVNWPAVAPLGQPYETEYVRPDGTRVPVLVGSLFLDEARREWASFVLDLTERKRAEIERQRRAEAEAAGRAKDEFLAMVSHELRTPFGAVLSSVHALRTGRVKREDIAPALERIERNTRLQARLIDDLLDLSRIVAGKLRLRRERVLLECVVSDAVASLQHSADVKGVALHTSPSVSTHHVLGDSERLQQIALNLIENAIKFTPPSGHIIVGVAHDDSKTVLSVRDTGRGIEPELLSHIFDRFHQGSGVGHRDGLGLGLAIVRHLVEAHGGTVRAESPGRGGGAVFTVALPSAPIELAASSMSI